MIIDQHRAHMRILYEDYISQMKQHKANVQKVLFPEVVQFTKGEEPIVKQLLQQLADIGFEMNDLGGAAYSVTGVPSGIDGLNVSDVLHEMVASAAEHDGSAVHDFAKPLAISLARHAAIPYGQVLNNEEMENVINRLFACSNINNTPDGKVILTVLSQRDIDKLF